MKYQFDDFKLDGISYSGWIEYETKRASKPNSRWATTCSASELPAPDGEPAEFELVGWGEIAHYNPLNAPPFDVVDCTDEDAKRVAEAVFADLDGDGDLEEENPADYEDGGAERDAALDRERGEQR